MRLRIFVKNLEYINQHNQEAAQGMHTFTLAVNHLADLTKEEYRQLLGTNVYKKQVYYQKKVAPVAIPDHVDWRDEVSYI